MDPAEVALWTALCRGVRGSRLASVPNELATTMNRAPSLSGGTNPLITRRVPWLLVSTKVRTCCPLGT